MRTYMDCVPCFFRQALEAARLAELGEKKQKKIIDMVAKAVQGFSLCATPPEMGQKVHAIVRKVSGSADPYVRVKEKSHALTLGLYPVLKRKVNYAQNKLLMAVELAIAGNIIDFGVKNSIDVDAELKKILRREARVLQKEDDALFQYARFTKALSGAKTLLYLGDNVGETVFDRVLIEVIKRYHPELQITYAVRGAPVLNDALEADAYAAGIHRYASVITNGFNAPGTILARCSRSFVTAFEKADLVISKGQGNYESLSEVRRPVFFLFMAKCPVVAEHLGCPLGSIVLRSAGARRKRRAS